MTAIERIKSFEKIKPLTVCCNLCPSHEVKFLLKAFKVMREIAVDWHHDSEERDLRAKLARSDAERHVLQEFEQRIKE